MAWVPVHQSLIRHPKLIRLSVRLGMKRTDVIGHLVALWCWAMDYAPKGNLSGFLPEEIALGSEWERTPSDWVSALTAEGWLEDDGYLHDWSDYGGALVEKQKKDAKRKREERKGKPQGRPPTPEPASNGRPTDVRVTAPVDRLDREERGEREDARADDASLGNLRPEEDDAHIPSADEVKQEAAMRMIPLTYAEHYHEQCEIKHRWVTRQGRLINWRREIVAWWNRDRSTWNEKPGDGRAVEEIEADLRGLKDHPDTPENYARKSALLDELTAARQRA